MKISGIQVKREKVTIEIDPIDLVENTINLINETHQHKKGEFIETDGYWQVYAGHDNHKNESVYCRGDLATDEEKYIEDVKRFLRRLLSRA